MSRKTLKGKKLSYLISKANKAYEEKFYLETIFLCHSIIEERLRSTVLKTDGDFGKKHKIPGCVKRFKKNIKDKNFMFHLFFSEEQMKQIYIWKKSKRDNLIHEIENNFDVVNDIDKLHKIANEGILLMKNLNSTVMRWKKQAIKHNVIDNKILEDE